MKKNSIDHDLILCIKIVHKTKHCNYNTIGILNDYHCNTINAYSVYHS